MNISISAGKRPPTLEAMTLRWMNENGLGGQNAGFCVDSITACVEMVKRSWLGNRSGNRAEGI
ncbi:MAG: hypothetical protein MR426_11820 [Clostridiales bacterium]|nr:hypothetical protein [Clostridiales bacterium]